MLIRYLVLATILHRVYSRDDVIVPKAVIGGFFDKNASMRLPFSLAVRTMNVCMYNHEICEMMHPTEDNINVNLFHQVEFSAIAVEVDDDLTAIYKKFGEISGASESPENSYAFSINNEHGLSVVIGPHQPVSAPYMQGLCEIHDIPHVVIRPELEHNSMQSMNLYPDTETLANVYVQMVKKLNWKSFSILYENTENLIALDNVLKMYQPFTSEIRAFKLGSGPNFSEPLLKAKFSKHKSFLVDCGYGILYNVLRQAQEVGIMSESYKFIITNLDLQTIDLWPFKYSGVNISGLRLVDPDNPFVSSFVGAHLEDLGISSVDKLLVEDALMFDAVALFAQGFRDFAYQNPISYGAKLPKDYSRPYPWRHGLSLRNYMLYNTLTGLTGPLMIDTDGVRRRFKLDVLNLHQTGLMKVGTWNPEEGFDELTIANEITVEHFKVLITLNPPYAMKVNHSKSMEGNARYEGFVIDIIKALAKEMKFNYTFYVQDDSDNGNCTKHEVTEHCTCTGMMEKILNHEMDMAITDLTITESRAQCIQFSTAFWNLGMSILYKKPQKAEATWYSFFLPFQSRVWLYLGFTWIAVSVLFFTLGRISAAEWTNPYPCIDEPTHLENQFTIVNSFWFTIGSLMQQGSDLAPIGMSTRCLAGCWWFFCLIIVNTYIANLAAFLTVETPVKVVRGIEDLYNQTNIKYGAKKGGSTFTYFQSSSDPKHKQLYERMIEPEWMEKWMVDKNEKGIELAKDENVNYAFLTESSSIEYVQHRICNLEQAGGLIDQKAYAIGYAKNFKYVKEVDKKISKLNENSVIKDLYKKWWTEKGAVCGGPESSAPQSMTLSQLVGVFYVLGVGIAVAFVVTFYEFSRGVHVVAKTESADWVETFKSEMKSVMGSKSVKPVLKKQRSSETNCSDSYSCDLTMTTQA